MARDNQRQRVYNAEGKVPKHYLKNFDGEFKTVADMQAWVNTINNSRWLKGFIKKHPAGIMKRSIVVKDGRGRRKPCAEIYIWEAWIKMPKFSRSRLTLIHELAHVYTPVYVAGHGPEFCATYLDFVKRWLGKGTHAALKAAFTSGRVKHRRI